MIDELFVPNFNSALAQILRDFLHDKRSRGYTYRREVYHLQQLDRFLLTARLTRIELPEPLVQQWLDLSLSCKPSTHRKRLVVLRQLVKFLQLKGYSMNLPLLPWTPQRELKSAARIFSHNEMRALFDAADRFEYNAHTPFRHLVVPELFRVLYVCGLRVGEARRLTVSDVDLSSGILCIDQGNFHRDRLVPLAPALQCRLQRYATVLGVRPPDSAFFPAPQGRHYGGQGVYSIFRELLKSAGIVHGGRGSGPRQQFPASLNALEFQRVTEI